MTDTTPASWLPDPTGRHHHRYWDGTRWTEHVADAGVAATDPQGAPDLPPPAAGPAEPPSPEEPAAAAPAAEEPARAEPTPTVEQPATPAEPSLGAGPAGAPLAPEPAPTVVSPQPAADPTTTWSAPSPPPPAGGYGAPPPPVSPIPPAPVSGSGGGSKKGFLIGLGVLVVVALVVGAVLLLGDDDDDGDDRDRIRAEMVALMTDGGIDRDDAGCVADRMIDDLGVGRLRDVDFDADRPPADLEDDFEAAAADAMAECGVFDLGDDDVDLDVDLDDLDQGDDLGIDEDLDLGELGPEFEEVLADTYAETFGLDADRARCLAERIADAMETGAVDESQMMSAVFDSLSECDIDLSEIGAN